MCKVVLPLLSALVIMVCGAAAPLSTANAAPLKQAPDTSLAETINAYRADHGQPPIKITYHLTYIAAYRVQLTMFSDVNMGAIQIDTRLMPPNYSWQELTFGGDSPEALAVNTPQAVLEDLVGRRNLSDVLLDPQFRHLGASLLCNSFRCGYVVILGRPN